MGKKETKEHCCDSDNLLKCLCAIDKEIACFKECGHTKHVNHLTREKILFCMIMRDIAKLDKKLDLILRELNSDWDTSNFCESDSENFSCSSESCSCSSDSESCSYSESTDFCKKHHKPHKPHKQHKPHPPFPYVNLKDIK